MIFGNSRYVKAIASLAVIFFSLSVLPLTSFAQALDLEPPEIEHEVISIGVAGEDQLFSADVTDNVSIASVALFYRFGDSGEYLKLMMKPAKGDSYVVSIDTTSGEENLIQYYFEAVDKAGSATNRGFTFNPLEREIKTPFATQPVAETDAKPISNTLWYVLGGVLLAGLVAGAASSGGGGSSDGCTDGRCTVTLQLTQPEQ